MGDSEQPSCSTETSDTVDDLDLLLDNALGDFEKPLPKVTPPSAPVANKGKVEQKSSTTGDSQWGNKEFKQIQDAMQSFLKDDPEFQEFEKLAGGTGSADFSASLEEAMKSFADNTQTMPDLTVEELSKIFTETNFTEGGTPFLNNLSQPSDVKNLMCTLMQSLLSKDVLYPALKDIVNKYPEWLADNRLKMEDSVYQKYSQQYDFMKQICEEFEADHEQSESAQAKVFDKVLGLMQKMQECGNPPKELMGPHYEDLPLNELGNFKMDGLAESCSIM